MGLLVDWTRLRRESALQEVSVETFTTKKVTEEKLGGEKNTEYPGTMGQLHKVYNLCVTGVPEKMERNRRSI